MISFFLMGQILFVPFILCGKSSILEDFAFFRLSYFYQVLFRKQHFKNVSSISPQYFELRDIYSLLREFVAYYIG